MHDTAPNELSRTMSSGPRHIWQNLSLAGQFAIVGSAVLLVGMVVIGTWVTGQIKDGVTKNSATVAAFTMDGLLAPALQELATADSLSAEAQINLDNLIHGTELNQRIQSIKIWKENGLVVYSTNKSIIGTSYPVTENLARAWRGEVAGDFDELHDEEDELERAADLPLLEMYGPIREIGTGRIIAVAEVYEVAEELSDNLLWVTLLTWLVVAIVSFSMLGAVYGIVLRGSRTIDIQRRSLERQVRELSTALAANEELRDRVQNASRRTSEINEQFLRRISADLHDGPAQLLALGLLRLDSLKPQTNQSAGNSDSISEFETVRGSLSDALADIRNICSGLTLPELSRLSPTDLLYSAAKAHERHTGSTVQTDIHSAPSDLSQSEKICAYRFVQETLSNAFRHADGIFQRLVCDFVDGQLAICISDNGPGFDPSVQTDQTDGLGLRGLRERIESLGGSMKIDSTPGKGSRITMFLSPEQQRNNDS